MWEQIGKTDEPHFAMLASQSNDAATWDFRKKRSVKNGQGHKNGDAKRWRSDKKKEMVVEP